MPKIVFACQSNSCRSQMAEGWAREWMRLQLERYGSDEQQQDKDDDAQNYDANDNTASSSLERLQSTFICSVALNEDVLKHKTVKLQAVEAMRQSNIDISQHYPKTLSQALDELILPQQQHASNTKPIDKLIVLCSCGDNVRAKLEELSKQVCVWNIEAPSKITKGGDSDAYQRVSLQIRDRIYELMEQSVLCDNEGVCEGGRCCEIDFKTGTVGSCDDD